MSSIYEEEAAKLSQPAKGSAGGGGDFDWLQIEKPASVGQKSVTNIRILPRLQWLDGNPTSTAHPKFWVRLSQHKATIDGKFTSLTCPEDRDQPGWRDRATCPMCILQKELWATKRKDYDEVAKDLGARWRVFCNVIDLGDVNGHWTEDGSGGWTVRPKVYAYSKTVHDAIINSCIHNGPVEDIETGRPMVLTCERTGKLKMNVKYAITHKDREPIDAALLPIVYAAHDLEGLRKPASMDDLRRAANVLDPRPATGGVASRSTSAVGASPPVRAAGGPPPPAGPSTPAGGPAAPPPPTGGVSTPPPSATPPPPVGADAYAPRGGYAVGGPPASTAAAPPPPPVTAAAPPPPASTPEHPKYHYSGPQGQHTEITPSQVVQFMEADPAGPHHVWAEGMAGWEPAADQSDVQQILGRTTAPPAPGGATSPPGPPGGPAF